MFEYGFCEVRGGIGDFILVRGWYWFIKEKGVFGAYFFMFLVFLGSRLSVEFRVGEAGSFIVRFRVV